MKPEYIEGYDHIFSYYDFPSSYENLRKYLPKKKNKGLTLRWEIALDEMERFASLSKSSVNKLLKKWNSVVNTCITKSVHFELMPHQDRTNSTIISFTVKDGKGGYLGYEKLRQFFKYAVLKEYDCFDRFNKIFFGQPVRYGHGAFIRLALGSNNVYNLLKQDPKTRFNNDIILVDLLERQIEGFLAAESRTKLNR